MRSRANVSRARQGGEPRSRLLLRNAREERRSEQNTRVNTKGERAEKLVVGARLHERVL
jgi:hypothetical protein